MNYNREYYLRMDSDKAAKLGKGHIGRSIRSAERKSLKVRFRMWHGDWTIVDQKDDPGFETKKAALDKVKDYDLKFYAIIGDEIWKAGYSEPYGYFDTDKDGNCMAVLGRKN